MSQYPSNHANDPRFSDDIDRDLAIINQAAGSIEFVNTQGDESLTVVHKNGGYDRFDKFGKETLVTRNARTHVVGDTYNHHQGKVVNHFDQGVENISLGDITNTTGDPVKQQPLVEEYKDKIKGLHDDHRLFEIQRTKSHNSIDQSPKQKKSGALAPCPTDAVIGKFLVSDEPSEVTARAVKADCYRTIFEFDVTEDIYEEREVGGGINCFTCWGTALSPSSQDGTWASEGIKKQIKAKREKLQEDLYNIEKQLGQTKNPSGGTNISNVSKDMILNVGLSFNDLESFRRDPKGKLVPYGVKIDPLGGSVYTQYRESPLVEIVDVERFPGGAYEINANNNYRVTAGSGGIDFKTTGPMDLYAPIVTLASEAILFNSRGELVLGAERIDLSGDIITLRPNKVVRKLEDASGADVDPLPANEKPSTEPEQQVLIDGNLNVAMNTIIRGGLHAEGEVTLHHITAPMEYHITESDFEIEEQTKCESPTGDEETCVDDLKKGPTHADILEGCIIGRLVNLQYSSDSDGEGLYLISADVESVCAPNSVLVHPHFHTYKSLPMKLIEGDNDMTVTIGDRVEDVTLTPHDAVRAIGARNNFANVVLAKPVKDSTTPTTVIEKFGGKCETLDIDNCSWEEPNRNDDLPTGDGVATSKYTPEVMMEKIKDMEAKLEQMYKEVQTQLASPSKENPRTGCDAKIVSRGIGSLSNPPESGTQPPTGDISPQTPVNQESNSDASANIGALNVDAAQKRCDGLSSSSSGTCLRGSRQTVQTLTGNSYYGKGYSGDYSLKSRTNYFLGGKNSKGESLYTNIGKSTSNFQTGDVIIYSNSGYGHVETNVNGRWYSDFKQNNNSVQNKRYSDYTVLRLNNLTTYAN